MTATLCAQRPKNITTSLVDPTDEEFLHLVRTGVYDTGARIPTFAEFDRRRRLQVAEACGITGIETYRHLHDDGLRALYADYISARFDRGAYVPDFIWRLLPTRARTMLARTVRGRANRLSASQTSIRDAFALNLNKKGDPVFA